MKDKTITSDKALKEMKALRSYWSDETRLTQKTIISILKRLENLESQNERLIQVIENLKSKKRSPSKYNLFVQKEMRKGKSMKEAVDNWNNLKSNKK